MRTFALIGILVSTLFAAACVDTDTGTDVDVAASAREARPIARQLPSALHDEPSSDTVSPPAGGGENPAGPIDPGQPSTDTVGPSGARDRLDTIDPGQSPDTVDQGQPGVQVIPCRPAQERSAITDTAPSAFELGQRARARWQRLHASQPHVAASRN